MVGYREGDSRSSYIIEFVEISCASDVSVFLKELATQKLEMSWAALMIVFAPTLVLLASSLQELSVVYQWVRGVKILLVPSEVPQALSNCLDSDPIRMRNGLKRGQHVIRKWIQIVPQLPGLLCP